MSVSKNVRNAFSARNRLVAAGALAVVASGGMIWGASSAAFSGSTENNDNTWNAAEVVLSNDHQATALFKPTNITPGYTESHCITVTSDSTKPVTVKAYAADLAAGALADNLQVSVFTGSGGTNVDGNGSTNGSCNGFTADGSALFTGSLTSFAALDYATAASGTELDPDESTQYRFVVSLADNAPNSLQGATTGASFVWEAQS